MKLKEIDHEREGTPKRKSNISARGGMETYVYIHANHNERE
jgi:hypothetical protein